MADADTNRKVTWWLASALALTLLALAFLLGRESMRLARMVETTDDVSSSETDPVTAQGLRVEEAPRTDSPSVDGGATEESAPSINPANPRATARVERRPDGRIVLSNMRDDEKRDEGPAVKTRSAPRKSPDQPKSVADYLDLMDTIRYGEEAADPNLFAMALIKAGMSGSTEGFDQLIADTNGMEQEMKSITPPPSCEKYHEASLEALRHGRAILIELKSAISTRDVSKVAEVAQEAAALQAKTDELTRLETNLRAVRQRPRP
ncbi:MAG: hypothetical protein OER77_03460 [Myxococcales bacterium]|nr:hypothetical protein [Myxococcales bacterium]